MKITIYELLGLIKDGKAPKKIIYADIVYEYCERMERRFNYKNIETGEYFSDEWFIENILSNIVEIIEEDKKIEKLNLDTDKLKGNEKVRAIDYLIEGKINELIEEIEKLKGKSE